MSSADAAAAAAPAPEGDAGDASAPPPTDGPVVAAGLKGVLNPVPTLGFLHSLQRVLPTLDATFERCVGGEAGAVAEAAPSAAP